jgi:hypothetical protein
VDFSTEFVLFKGKETELLEYHPLVSQSFVYVLDANGREDITCWADQGQ